jgi:hypothetical protein
VADRATFSATGKQVLRNREHFADARDERAAEAIAIMFNQGAPACDTPIEQALKVHEVVWG